MICCFVFFLIIIRGGAKLDPDLRAAAYRAAVSSLFFAPAVLQQNFDWLLAYYQSAGSTAADRMNALMLLCRTTDTALVDRLLDLSLDESKIRAQDTASVLIASAIQHRGRVWSFVERNFDTLKTRYAKHLFTFSNLVTRVAEGFRTQEALDAVSCRSWAFWVC